MRRWYMHVCERRHQILGAGVSGFVCCLIWVVEIKFGSFARTVHLTLWVFPTFSEFRLYSPLSLLLLPMFCCQQSFFYFHVILSSKSHMWEDTCSTSVGVQLITITKMIFNSSICLQTPELSASLQLSKTTLSMCVTFPWCVHEFMG